LAIGDSVLLAASPALRADFGASITVDAAVGRQVAVGLQRLAEYRAGDQLARYATVLIDLGTNGPFTPDQFAQFVQLTAGVKQVVFCDVYVPRSWQKTTDATVTAGVAAHPGMRLLDWYRAAPRPGLLYPDGVHPSPAGAQVFSQLLTQTLSQ
jgi:hypothetical protein